MSGIAGILRFDGKPVERRDLERMANALRVHGPDRSEVLVSGNVGLVHVLMRMTPEDRFDRQPWRGASGAIITADLRLDNRDEVLARIGMTPQDAMAWSDSRVLLVAWEKFGDDLWATLRGPFAVAIWNPARPHADARPRSSGPQRRDVPQDRALLRLRDHAEGALRRCPMFRAS